jgi:hypothetical protein
MIAVFAECSRTLGCSFAWSPSACALAWKPLREPPAYVGDG